MENKEEAKVGAKVRIKEPAIWNRPVMDPSNGFGADSAMETWTAPGSRNIRQMGIFRKKWPTYRSSWRRRTERRVVS
jgi:hypothetical protein